MGITAACLSYPEEVKDRRVVKPGVDCVLYVCWFIDGPYIR